MNPFQPLYAACNNGDPKDKYENLPDFPRLIDIEPVSFCNFRCVMCPTGLHATGREAEFMRESTYWALLAECAKHDTAIRFIGWGEPLLHPQIVSFVRAANDIGLLTHINTNGSKLEWDVADDLIAAGLSSLKYSFQGVTREGYAEMRQTDFFEGLLEVAEMVRDIRANRPLPYLHLSTTITCETQEEVADFRRRAAPLVDGLTIGRTVFDFIDSGAIRVKPEQRSLFERLKSEATAEKRHPDPCPEVYDKLSIHADGTVVVCCNAFGTDGTVGEFPDKSLTELWRHPVLEDYRERLARKEYSGPLCSVCYDYQSLTEGVQA